MLRQLAIRALAAVCLCGLVQAEDPSSGVSQRFDHAIHKTLADVKSEYSDSAVWKDIRFEDKSFAVCQEVKPTFGVSIITIHGWVFRKKPE